MGKQNGKRFRLITIAAAIVILLVSSIVFGAVGFILTTPLALLLTLFIPRYRPTAVGALFGWFIWFRDYDYCLNAGGPETPLCDAIRATLGLQDSNIGLLFPALGLVLAGSIIAFLCQLLFLTLKQSWR